MIRPRIDSAYHDYARVFADLRSGLLTVSEYEVMCAEDLLETNRRSALVAYNREVALSGIRNMAVPEAEGGKGDDYPTKDEKLVIRNEQSGAY